MLDLNTALSFFAAIAMTIAEVLGKLVIAVLDVTIPVMQYQGFTSSPVVIAGWALVRDTVNMFFVVVLILIAMGTIFGSSRAGFQWKQTVPRLMIFALVINFSKTLCGIMIDFAQVVMLTFANALKDIAGGNFIQLLGLGDVFSLSEKAQSIASSAAGTGTGTGPFDYFAASVAAVFMMIWVLAVVLMLLVILVYRVVMLWVLIVMAPLAWFMGGQSVFKSDAYAEWWKNFTCYTAIGPVITFFLWLTLAVAGSGFIAANDPGFSSAVAGGDINSNASDFVTKIFEFQRLLSFFVGMAMLMAGFDAAAKICSGVKGPGFQTILSAGKGVPGRIGGLVSRGSRKGLAAAGSGLKIGGAAVGAGLVGAGATGLAITGSTLAGRKSQGGQGAVKGFAQGLKSISPFAGGQAARAKGLRDLSKQMPASMSTVAKDLSAAADSRQKDLAEKVKKATEAEFKDLSQESKVDYLKNVAKGGMPANPDGKKAALGLLAEAIKDPGMREKLEAAGVLGTLYSAHSQTLKDYLRNTPDYKMLDEFEAGRPDITKNVRGINDMADVDKLDSAALARLKDEADRGTVLGNEFKARMQTIKSNTKKQFKVGEILPDGTRATSNQTLTLDAWSHFESGMGGVKKQKAWKNGMTGVYEGMGKTSLNEVPVEELVRYASPDLVSRREDLAQRVLTGTEGALRNRVSGNAAIYRSAASSNLGIKYGSSGSVDSIDASKLKAALKQNPSVLMNLPTDELETDRALAVGIADNLNEGVLNTLVKQYAKASGDQREAMDASVIENVFVAMEEALDEARFLGDTAEETRLDDLIVNLHRSLVKIDGTKADTDAKLNGTIAKLKAQLAAERAKGRAGNAELISRLTNDTSRLTNRTIRHSVLP